MAYSITIDTNLNTARISQQVDTAVNQFSRFENRVRSASTAANRSVNSIRLDTAIGEINSFAMNSQNAASILDLLQDSVVGFSGKIPAMAGSIAAIVAVIAAFAKIGADAADVFNDMSDRTGVTIENLVGLQLAAQLADTDLESLATSVNKLSVNIANNRDEFAQLGITATDPLEALMQLADVFSSIEDPQERAALGSKALGKSYAELAPLLLQGGAALRKQIQLGQKLSGITTEDAKRAGEFNDSLDVMMFKLKGIGIEIGTVTLMALEQLSNELKTNTEGAETFNNWLEAIGNQMSKGFGIEPFHGMSAAIDDVNQKIINQKALIDGLQKQQNQGGIDWQIGGVSLIGQNKGNGVTLIKKIGEIADSLVGRDVNLEKNRLDALYKERAQLIKGLLDKKQRSANPAATTIKALNTRALYSQATEKYNLRPLLVQAIANVESNGIQAKTSPKGGVGIMQVVPKYHPELDATRLKSDPAYNVDKGAEYLSRLNKMFVGNF